MDLVGTILAVSNQRVDGCIGDGEVGTAWVQAAVPFGINPFLSTPRALDLLPGCDLALRMKGWQAYSGPASGTVLWIARLPLAGRTFLTLLILFFFSGLVTVPPVFEHQA